jgi:hypothetical protein
LQPVDQFRRELVAPPIETMARPLYPEANRESPRGPGNVARVMRTPGPGKTVLRLAYFFALVGLLAVGTDALITAGLRRISTSTFGAWNQMMEGKVNAHVVITGSSRAEYHYDPRTIEAVTGHTAVNLGRNGSQTDVQLAVLRAYLEHNRKPQLVIHNLDAFTFVTTREVFEPAQYVPYLRDPQLYRDMRQLDPNFAKARYIPLYGYVVQDMNFSWILGLRGLVGWPPRQDSFSGFVPRDKEWTNEFGNFKANHPAGVDFGIEPKGIGVLEQMMRLCKDNGIPLVLVYSPEYTGMQALENNRARIFAEFQRLASQYNVPIWDYSQWKYSSDTQYFYNSQHLNARGAAIFSDDLANRLKEYLPTLPTYSASLKAPGATNSAAARQ